MTKDIKNISKEELESFKGKIYNFDVKGSARMSTSSDGISVIPTELTYMIKIETDRGFFSYINKKLILKLIQEIKDNHLDFFNEIKEV